MRKAEIKNEMKAEIKNEIKEEIKEERNVEIKKETPLALVTGASGGIGYAIAVKLSVMGYRVYGIGRDFGKVPGGSSSATLPFNPIELDLRKKGAAESISGLLRQEGRLRILVHAAGVAYYGFHETVHPERLQEMVEVNLTVPMVLTRHFLRELKEEKGHIFFIDSITALHENVYGAAYGATKAGLLSFARSLFQEQRKTGLKVHSILPDMTDTALYRNADFTVGERADSFLLPSDVSRAVEMILEQREGVVLEEVHLRPQVFQIKKRS